LRKKKSKNAKEVCDDCNSPRPRCIICYQDLKPSEEENVVILPCCQIYAHREHIKVWLRKKPSCPNCHADLSIDKQNRNIKKGAYIINR